MPATRQDIIVEQGSTFELVIDLLDEDGAARADLAGYTGAMQIRDTDAADGDLLATATVTIDVGASQAIATIDDDTTADYGWTSGVYDMEITNGARTERVVYGTAQLHRQVTR